MAVKQPSDPARGSTRASGIQPAPLDQRRYDLLACVGTEPDGIERMRPAVERVKIAMSRSRAIFPSLHHSKEGNIARLKLSRLVQLFYLKMFFGTFTWTPTFG